MLKYFIRPLLGGAILMALAISAQADLRLLMVEQTGCAYCRMWDSEIAGIYPKTPEGQLAPLQRYDLHDALPDGVSLKSKPVFTPTFILLRDGVEVNRLEGYPGEDFFWGLLLRMLEPLPEWQGGAQQKS